MSTPQQSVGASLIRRLSARGAIMGQVLSFCLLMLPIVGYSMWAEWNYEKTTQRSQLLHTVKALAARQTALTRGSESRLKALSFTPIIQRGDPEEVFPFLVLFNQLEEDYVGVALFRPDGSGVAGVLNGKAHVVPAETIRKQQYFIQALARRGFSVGNSLTTNDGGIILPMTMPVLDQNGEPRFILLLPLGIDQQHKALDTFLEENGGKVVLFDGDWRLLFEHPEAVGKAFSKEYVERELYPQAFRHTEGKPGESVFSFHGPEGEALVGAMTFLYQGNEERPYISILAFDNQLTWAAFLVKGHILQLIGLSIITFLLLYTSNRLGSLCFADGLGHMAGVALKAGEGDAAVRCGSVVGCREIVILGRALDGMLDVLQKSAHKLRALSMHDPLTGLWNRRQFTEMALQEIRASGRYGHRLALGMADIDHFKAINDTYGHGASHRLSGKMSASRIWWPVSPGKNLFSFSPTRRWKKPLACWRHCAGRVRKPRSRIWTGLSGLRQASGWLHSIRAATNCLKRCWIRLSAMPMRRCMFPRKTVGIGFPPIGMLTKSDWLGVGMG